LFKPSSFFLKEQFADKVSFTTEAINFGSIQSLVEFQAKIVSVANWP